MLKFSLEYHSFKKMSPSTRTTVIFALISILVLLAPYLPIRRGPAPLLSTNEVVSSPTTLNKRPPPPSTIEKLRAKTSDLESEDTSSETFNLRPMMEETPVLEEPEIMKKKERQTTGSRDSEPPLESDSLDDIDSFLDTEQ